MAGFRIVVDGLEESAEAARRIADYDKPAYLDALGALVTSQTQNRIRSEKTAPDGTPWKPNRAGTSILFKSGALDDSIRHIVGGSDVEVGSNLIYAGVHQEGATIVPKNGNVLVFGAGGETIFAKKVTIPARPYLGVSAENGSEIETFTLDFVAGEFR